MNFFRMLLVRIDPFAVYDAERKLRDAGIALERKSLVDHMLVVGQLRTLVDRLIRSERRSSDWIENEIASDIVDNSEVDTAGDYVVNPLATGMFHSTCAVCALLVCAGFYALRIRALTSSLMSTSHFFGVLCGVLGFAVAGCFAHAYLGARIGRRRSKNVAKVFLGILIVTGVIYLAIKESA